MRTVEKDGIEAEPRQKRARNPITGRNELVDGVPYNEWLQQQKDKDPKASPGFAINKYTKTEPEFFPSSV